MGGAESAQTEDGRGEGEGEVVEGEAAPTRVDVSEYVLDAEEDVGETQYRVTLVCNTEQTRLSSQTPVTCDLGGPSKRRLTVTVGDRVYHRMRLPGTASSCQAKKKCGKKEDVIVLTLEKSEPKLWRKG